MADSLASTLNAASSPVTATVAVGGSASAAQVTLTTKTTGSEENGTITLSLAATEVKAAATSMSGGAGPTHDNGTVTATVNGSNFSTSYGQASTPQSIAQALAVAINGGGAGFAVSAGSGGSLTVSAGQAGTADNGMAISFTASSGQPKFFSSPSFSGTSGSLSGGTTGTTTPGVIYSYVIPPSASNTGYAANGNLLSYTDSVTGAWAQHYSYLNTLSSIVASSGPWNGVSVGWGYDNFGNRTSQTSQVAAGTTQTAPYPGTRTWVYPSNNQANTLTYDPPGWVT